MDAKSIVEILRANHVKVHAKFERACCSDGCINALRDLYDGAMQEISALLVYGVNRAGFTSPVRKTINQLSQLLVAISQKTSVAEYAKLKKKLEKLTGTIKVEEGVTQMKNEVFDWISAYRTGIEVVYQSKNAIDRKPILIACLAKLSELETILANVVDVSTKEALEHAKKILELLKPLADTIARGMHNSATSAKFDAVLEEARRWAEQRAAKQHGGLFGSKKGIDISEIAFNPENETVSPLIRIAQSAEILENINNFQSNLSEYKAGIERRYSTQNDAARIQALEAELSSLGEAVAQLEEDYNNGRVSEIDVEFRMDGYEERKLHIEDELEELQHMVCTKTETYYAMTRVADMLDRLLSIIESYAETDMEIVSLLGKEINFTALYNLMHGQADLEDQQSVSALAHIKDCIEEHSRVGSAEFAARLKAQEAARRTRDRAQRDEVRARRAAQETQTQGERRGNVSERFKNFSRRGAQQPQQPSQPTQPQSGGQQSEEATENPTGGGMRNPTGGFQA